MDSWHGKWILHLHKAEFMKVLCIHKAPTAPVLKLKSKLKNENCLGIYVNVKNDKKQNNEQTIDHSVQEHGGHAGLHVHKFEGTLLARHLKQQSWWQKCKQRWSYQESSIIFHPQWSLLNLYDWLRLSTQQKNKEDKKHIKKGFGCHNLELSPWKRMGIL